MKENKPWKRNQRTQVTHSKANVRCETHKTTSAGVRVPGSGQSTAGPHLPLPPGPSSHLYLKVKPVRSVPTRYCRRNSLKRLCSCDLRACPSSAALSPPKLSL